MKETGSPTQNMCTSRPVIVTADGRFVFGILGLEIAFEELFLPRDDPDRDEAGKRCQS
jgi:hypothetical protein